MALFRRGAVGQQNLVSRFGLLVLPLWRRWDLRQRTRGGETWLFIAPLVTEDLRWFEANFVVMEFTGKGGDLEVFLQPSGTVRLNIHSGPSEDKIVLDGPGDLKVGVGISGAAIWTELKGKTDTRRFGVTLSGTKGLLAHEGASQ